MHGGCREAVRYPPHVTGAANFSIIIRDGNSLGAARVSKHRSGQVRVRITQQLTGSVDGIDLTRFLEGLTYEVGTTLGNYLLAQRWAEPVSEESPSAVLPFNRTILRPSILIVEDDEDMRQILMQLLEFHGWPAHAVSDGAQALDALQKHRPSLILLDLAMPRMNGVEFRTAQRRLTDRRLAKVPVVVVSAVHDAPDYKETLEAADVLMKPFDADRLLHAVERYVRPTTLFRV
jgi:CheY-like chemotaxis protein